MTGGYHGKNIQLNTDIHAVTVPETLPSYIISLPTYGEDIEHLFVGEEVQSIPMDWEFAQTLSLDFASREDVENQITNIVEQMTSFKIDEVRCFGLTQDINR